MCAKSRLPLRDSSVFTSSAEGTSPDFLRSKGLLSPFILPLLVSHFIAHVLQKVTLMCLCGGGGEVVHLQGSLGEVHCHLVGR